MDTNSALFSSFKLVIYETYKNIILKSNLAVFYLTQSINILVIENQVIIYSLVISMKDTAGSNIKFFKKFAGKIQKIVFSIGVNIFN